MIEERPCCGQEQSEARVTRRYPIAAQVSFQWRGPDRTWFHGTGVTQDISASGALISSDDVPPLGAEIEVMVMVPSVKRGAPATGRLSGTGTVVRLSPPAGFAAAVAFHILKSRNSTTLSGFMI